MISVTKCSGLVAGLLMAGLASPAPVQACAACYGQSDAPMAHGLNWGIFSLLLVVVIMLSGITSFFVYLAKRSAALSAGANQTPVTHQ